MIQNRRISTSRWWNKKNFWYLLIFSIILVIIRFSKTGYYKDIFYFISKPFWPGSFQQELILKSIDLEAMSKLDLLEQDNYRLRELLNLQRSSKNNISAAAISRQTSSWWRKIILNKGDRDGVSIGDAVIGPGGLIGIIENTSHYTSTVKLITSTESKIGVWLQKSKYHGLLVGVGAESCKLIFYSKDINIKVGDFVSSSPASTLLPPNIPIGIIESIDTLSKTNVTANVQVIAKPNAIDWVQIVKMSN